MTTERGIMAGGKEASVVETLSAPFPWFGGKRRVAPLVWQRFGADVGNYVEPFFGSGAVLLGRPGGAGPIETANDADGHVCNFWRALQSDAERLAGMASDLAHECDLHARHAHLVQARSDLTRRLEGDPSYYDVQLAAWWVWGIALWIGSGWCSGEGPWQPAETPNGRQPLHLGDGGQGINRQLLHLGSGGQGINRKLLHLHRGQGINSHRVTNNRGVAAYLTALSDRLRRVRFCCGDWARICGPTPTVKQGTTAVFLDPPYGVEAGRTENIYAADDLQVAARVLAWCAENGGDPRLRVALCGYVGEGHEMLEAKGWDAVEWTARGGYGAGKGGRGDDNKHRERVWFSPHCLSAAMSQPDLFAAAEGGDEG